MWIWGDEEDPVQLTELGLSWSSRVWTKRSPNSGKHLPDQLCLLILTGWRCLRAIVMIIMVSVKKTSHLDEKLQEANGTASLFWINPWVSDVSFLQNKENHGLVEKLTSLAALRAGDVEKIQKLESELDRAAAHRQNYEEKGMRYRASVEEVCAGNDCARSLWVFLWKRSWCSISHRDDFCTEIRFCCWLSLPEKACILEKGDLRPRVWRGKG